MRRLLILFLVVTLVLPVMASEPDPAAGTRLWNFNGPVDTVGVEKHVAPTHPSNRTRVCHMRNRSATPGETILVLLSPTLPGFITLASDVVPSNPEVFPLDPGERFTDLHMSFETAYFKSVSGTPVVSFTCSYIGR